MIDLEEHSHECAVCGYRSENFTDMVLHLRRGHSLWQRLRFWWGGGK